MMGKLVIQMRIVQRTIVKIIFAVKQEKLAVAQIPIVPMANAEIIIFAS
jgi:hypothetical protein